LHQVGDLFELNVKPRCQKVKLKSKQIYTPFCPHFDVTIYAMRVVTPLEIYKILLAFSVPEVKKCVVNCDKVMKSL
jgi:hypothetical protein